jgi:hypothetical protein
MEDQRATDRAEIKAFKSGVDGHRVSKQRGSQLLLVLGLAATFAGAWLADGGSFVGVVFLIVGFPTLLAAAWWSFRNWDY